MFYSCNLDGSKNRCKQHIKCKNLEKKHQIHFFRLKYISKISYYKGKYGNCENNIGRTLITTRWGRKNTSSCDV